METQLLPINAITVELLEKVAAEILKEDTGRTVDNPPEYWAALVAKCKAAGHREAFNSLLGSVRDMTVNTSKPPVGGLVTKLLYIGWRLADLYLSEQLEKGSDC